MEKKIIFTDWQGVSQILKISQMQIFSNPSKMILSKNPTTLAMLLLMSLSNVGMLSFI
jgi:hypothetical protein